MMTLMPFSRRPNVKLSMSASVNTRPGGREIIGFDGLLSDIGRDIPLSTPKSAVSGFSWFKGKPVLISDAVFGKFRTDKLNVSFSVKLEPDFGP